jgi:hypothetical protein
MKFHENCFVVRLDIACVVYFIATRPLRGEKGKDRNLKGETKELCIISVWLGVFSSSL